MSLSKILGFCPDNIRLYKQALLHKSSSVTENGKWVNNERLEFLGDAILDAIVGDIVYKLFPNKREGFLTKLRSKIVQRETMNEIAVKLGLDHMVVYSTKMNIHSNDMYGNALEALIGAIYLDQGYDRCYRFVNEILINKCININELVKKEVNFKSYLIEWSQKNRISVTFDLLEAFTDNNGNSVFQSAIILLGERIGIGTGSSKKESQQEASKMAIRKIRNDQQLQQRISEERQKYAEEHTEKKETSSLLTSQT